MIFRTVTPPQLTPDEIGAWVAIQRANPLLSSPYFRPEFTQAVAAVRDDVEVAVAEVDGRPVGFFPYQRGRANIGRPVGGRLSDFQALIAAPGCSADPLEMLRACHLSAWHFDHLLVEQNEFRPFTWRADDSPYIDLNGGLEGYLRAKENGSSLRSEYGQKRRKIEREVGPLRFEPDTRDEDILATCFRWKEQQYLRTGAPNVFAYEWVLKLFDKLLSYRGEDFAPMVSVLYAGDKIAAINFCLRSRNVLHAWFPAYNVEMASYSPGTLHWMELMRAMPAFGISRIDLGKGPEKFKRRFMSGAIQVSEGTVDLRLVATLVRRAWHHARDRIRDSRLYGPARMPATIIYRFNHWLECR